MSEIVLYPTDENEDKIWDKIEAYVNENIRDSSGTATSVFADAKVKDAILGVIQFERRKSKNSNIVGEIPSAPFAVAGPGYSSEDNKKAGVRVALQSWVKFRNLVDMLKTKTLARDAKFVSEHLQRIELVLNPARMTINGEDVVLRETPLSDPSKCVLKVTVKAMCKQHGRRVLDVTWNGFNAMYKVQLLRGETVIQQATVKGGRKQFVLRDDMDTSGYYIKLMHPDDNDAEKQGPFDCPKNEAELASVSSQLYDIDKFRLEICGKYKTVFDLLELVECPEYNADGAAINIVQALDFLRQSVKKEFDSKDKLDDDVLKWDSVVLLKKDKWRKLDHKQKVIRVLYQFLPSYLKLNAPVDDVVDYINVTFPELEEASTKSLLSYMPLRSNASVQRQEFTVGSKRGYTATFAPSQLEHAMRYATDIGKDKRMLSALGACPWTGAKEFFKNKERDGQKWKSMVVIEDDKEVRDCMRLRKVQAVLDSSVQKGRPVMYKQVAAPFNYTGESNSYRFTTFGARNFDMTQAAPAVMDAPYVLSKKNNAKKVIDPQHSYKELKLSKKGFIAVEHETGKRRHPIYPSRKKENLWAKVK